MAPPVTKKRWPWVVLAVVLLCGLPLGGCVALITFGVSEISDRKEAVEDSTAQFFTSFDIDESLALTSLIDGDSPCAAEAALRHVFDSVGPPSSWEFFRTAFVDRSGSGYIGSNADPETFVLSGREDGSLASVAGAVTTTSGTYDFDIVLTKPLATWRVCNVALE